jgi:hypothetical protein
MVVALELSMLPSNTRKQVCVKWFSFLFLMKYEKKKAHNVLFLMLNPRFKSLSRLVSSFINWEQVFFLMVEDYDRWSLFLLLLTCHHVLRLMLEFEIVVD